MTTTAFSREAQELLKARTETLLTLSWQEAGQLPDCKEESVTVAGSACTLTTFRQTGVLPQENAILITVQLARSRFAGIVTDHLERGLVFAPNASTRLAIEAELIQSGG